MAKSDRLFQIERLLLDHPAGLRRSELARRLGVHRSTIGRDITSLSFVIPIIEEDDGLLRLDRGGYLTTVRLSMFELEALHLAARLFARVMKFPFPHAGAALRKLADAQGRVSPRLAHRIRETAGDIERFAGGPAEAFTRYRTVVEQLGLAISEDRPVHLRHFSRTRGAESEYHLFPLTLEPHHEGRAVHLLAWDLGTRPGQFRTLKIERIRDIQLDPSRPELFDTIPAAELSNRLSAAWSIWATDQPPVPVVLQFSAEVADRVIETQWHASQRFEPQPDGRLIWRAEVSEPREMYPWIRGWGPAVEILEPEDLREQHRRDFEQGVRLYQ